MSKPRIPIIQLKPNQENITIIGRVIKTTPPRIINTKKGSRTISNAVIGDESGRVEVTLWGSKAGSLRENEVVEINGAWTTSFQGRIQLNIGKTTTVKKIDDAQIPPVEQIPETEPKAPKTEFKPRRGFKSGTSHRY